MGSVKTLGWLSVTLVGLFTPAFAVTDADRIAVYKEFRTQFDAKQYAAAQPLAERLVKLTEEQFGPDELQLTNPLTNLATIHYKLGNYAESVRFLERAVELKPQDPVLNDHLGDALWRVGREREAKFQWDQSLTLDPEPEEMEKIKKKLAEGMPPAAEAR